MNHTLRKNHRNVWIVVSVITIVLLLFAVLVRS